MISLLSRIGAFLVPTALAKNLEQLGAGTPGISEMWAGIMSVFPHTGVGEGGLNMLVLKIIDFVLKGISAVAVAMIIYAGIRIISGGDEGLGEGKKIVMYAAIGLVAAICADAIVIYAQVLIQAASA